MDARKIRPAKLTAPFGRIYWISLPIVKYL